MLPISETRRAVEWAALINQYPTNVTWDGDTYVCRLTDSRGYNLDPIEGGFVQGQTAQLFALNNSFTNGMPGEGDILLAAGVGWRVMGLTRVMGFGTTYQLEGRDKR